MAVKFLNTNTKFQSEATSRVTSFSLLSKLPRLSCLDLFPSVSAPHPPSLSAVHPSRLSLKVPSSERLSLAKEDKPIISHQGTSVTYNYVFYSYISSRM
jgi:hypothetical protein